MKKPYLLLFIILLFTPFLKGQEPSIVNFVATKVSKNAFYSIYMNDRSIGTIAPGENIELTMYSTGRFSLILIEANHRFTRHIDIEPGEEYFFEINSYRDRFRLFEDIDRAKKYYNSNTTIKIEEDINRPIGKIDESIISKRPGQGSGFLINKEGYLVTNNHVVEGAKSIKVSGIKGDYNTEFEATLIAVDKRIDLVLLKIESKLVTLKTPPYSIGDSKKMNKAEDVYTLGYPMESSLGNELKVTNGIINSLTGFKQSISEFQFSAAVQEGNSGGPLLNSNGEIVGVVSAKIRSDIADQISYAIKSNYLKLFLEEAGISNFNSKENQLANKELPNQVKLISDFIYIIKAE